MDTFSLDRRKMPFGLVADDVASGIPACSNSAQRPIRPTEPFQARSSDGPPLAGDAQGDPAAPEILFIHGARQSRLSWDRQFDDPVLSGFRMVRFDLRGHGDSGKPSSAEVYADLDLWGDDLAAVIKGSKLRRPVLAASSVKTSISTALNKVLEAQKPRPISRMWSGLGADKVMVIPFFPEQV